MKSPTVDNAVPRRLGQGGTAARRAGRPVVRGTAPWAVLVLDTVRSHRGGMFGWVLAAVIAMAAIGAGFAAEVARFPGGNAEMAASLEGAAQAMRPLRWPAERLDTLGGYLTYHNVTLFVFLLGVYAAVQGARAIRGAESKGALELVLATGRSRPAVLRDRAVGFAVVVAVIGAGLGASLALGMALGDAPDVGGSFGTAVAVAACTFTWYAVGVLAGQLAPTPRSATGGACLLVTGSYLFTNVADEAGPAGALRYLSPFTGFNASRALVPGHGVNIAACALLLAAALALLAAAAWAFCRRDYASGLIGSRRDGQGAPRPASGDPGQAAAPAATARRRVQRYAVSALWRAILVRERAALVAWTLAAAGTLGLMGALEPQVLDLWDRFDLYRMLMATAGYTPSEQYLSFAGQFIVPILAAFVLAQALGWVADLRQGRVELLLAQPLSWAGLLRHRMAALLAGAAVVTVGGLAGLLAAATAVGADVEAVGLVRLFADALLFAFALGGLSALIVAALRERGAVVGLAVLLGASYLLTFLVPLFAWPDWVLHLSVFGAFGNPYLDLPETASLILLAGAAVLGTGAAIAVAQRTAKTA